MKKSVFKLSAALLALLISFAPAVGCTSGGSPSAATSPAQASSGTGAPSQPEPATNLTFHHFMVDNYAVASPAGASTPERLEAVHQLIYDATGINIRSTVAPSANASEKLNMLLAGGEDIDSFDSNLLGMGALLHVAKQDMLLPLNDLLEQYGPHITGMWTGELGEDLWGVGTDENGVIWGIPCDIPMAGNITYVRKDWLDLYDLPVPTTVEELEEAMRVIKENDPAGNGETVVLLLEAGDGGTGNNGFNALAAGFMDTGYGPYFLDIDNKVKPIAYNDDFRDFVGTLADWYKAGYIFKEYPAMNDAARMIEMNKSGNVFAFAGWHSRVTSSMQDLQAVHGGEWVDLRGMKGDKGYMQTMGAFGTAGYCVLKDSPNGEAVIRYIDWEYSSLDNYMLALYGEKGVDYTPGQAPGEMKERTLEYVAEYLVRPNFGMTLKMDASDPNGGAGFAYYREVITNTDITKPMALQKETALIDWGSIQENTPYDDVLRMCNEEIVKFIMNNRPMSEYDQFLADLEKAGVEDVIEAATAAYDAVK